MALANPWQYQREQEISNAYEEYIRISKEALIKKQVMYAIIYGMGKQKIQQIKEKDMSKPNKAWLVINISFRGFDGLNSDGGYKLTSQARPSILHPTKGKAEAEAKRLAGVHKGETFMVFETCGAFVQEEPITRFTY